MRKLRYSNYGVSILKNLYQINKDNKSIQTSLIKAYIKNNSFNEAKMMIEFYLKHNHDLQSLEFRAWLAYLAKDLKQEKVIWNNIIKKGYFPAVSYTENKLIKLDFRNINIAETDIVLFTHIYNEISRLPSFFKHYRTLGVDKFIIIDNNSTDGSREWLKSQQDCHIFWTNNCHLESSSGMSWIKSLREELLPKNSWYLVVDADEYLIYPNYECKKLKEIISYMDNNGYEALPSFMLDMYPNKIEEDSSEQLITDPIKSSPFFYNDYHFIGHTRPPYFDVYGGIFYALEQQVIRLVKVPLIKNTDNLIFIMGNHNTTPAKFSDITSCVLHFKFIGDLKESSLTMIKEKRHWQGSIKYKSYHNIFTINPGKTYLSRLNKSTRFIDSNQLVKMKLMKNPRDF